MTGRMPKVYDPTTRSWVYPVYQADFGHYPTPPASEAGAVYRLPQRPPTGSERVYVVLDTTREGLRFAVPVEVIERLIELAAGGDAMAEFVRLARTGRRRGRPLLTRDVVEQPEDALQDRVVGLDHGLDGLHLDDGRLNEERGTRPFREYFGVDPLDPRDVVSVGLRRVVDELRDLADGLAVLLGHGDSSTSAPRAESSASGHRVEAEGRPGVDFRPDAAEAVDRYTVGDVARQLGVSRTTVHRWITQGLVSPSATTLGGHARFSEGDLEAIKATVIEAARVAPDDAEVSS